MNEAQFGENPVLWMGQIVDDKHWKDNIASEKWNDYTKLQGWGYRYKVRIFGKHTEDKSIIPDERLPWAEVLYPVTAGSGHGASYQSSNLRKGAYVYGFYKDSSEKTGPIIIGCLPNADQTKLSNTIPNTGFVPFSAFIGERVPIYSIPPGGSPASPTPGGSGAPIEGAVCTPTANNACDQKQKEDGVNSKKIAVSSDCEQVPLGHIQKDIQKLLHDVQDKKKQLYSWKNSVSASIIGISDYIKSKIDEVAKSISKWLKKSIKEIEQFLLNKINEAAKKLYYALFPGEQRSKLKKSIDTVNDLIACLFRKIVSNLFKMVGEFLKAIVERFINTPLCAVENFVAALLGKITGLITSAINIILAPLQAILGVVDIIGDIFGLIENILSFLTCDDRPQCPEVKEWSIWDGPGNSKELSNSNFNTITEKAKKFASDLATSIDPNTFTFDLNFSDVFSDTCNVGPVFCGPPIVEFFGGSGSGATGNAIVSATGKILGVDITNGGVGYSSAPTVRFVDGCGKGSGAVARSIISTGIGTTSSGTVTGVVVNEAGAGYISVADGSLGGDGKEWAKNYDTTIQRKDGTYDVPYPPGETIEIREGDKVRFPLGAEVNINGQIVTGGQYVTSISTANITTPPPSDLTQTTGSYPTLGTGKYPVILTLCDTKIKTAGINYSPTDTIVIEPSNGAEATPVFGSFGTLSEVKIVSVGIGFTERPKIYVQSETGYNAEIVPVLCVSRVSENELKDPTYQDKIISVIDCVGKV